MKNKPHHLLETGESYINLIILIFYKNQLNKNGIEAKCITSLAASKNVIYDKANILQVLAKDTLDGN